MKLKNGIYLIIDPSMDKNTLIGKLKEVIEEDICAIQIWDNFKPDDDPKALIEEVISLCHSKNIPVLINNQWQLLKETHLDGVHFDIPSDIVLQVRNDLQRDILIGITCNNDILTVEWADTNKLDYISFCSMFPSSTANSCELVTFDTVKKAKQITKMPVFLAGGITPEKVQQLNELEYSGIAVVSGIMNADNPTEAVKQYKQKIKNIKNETRNH